MQLLFLQADIGGSKIGLRNIYLGANLVLFRLQLKIYKNLVQVVRFPFQLNSLSATPDHDLLHFDKPAEDHLHFCHSVNLL